MNLRANAVLVSVWLAACGTTEDASRRDETARTEAVRRESRGAESSSASPPTGEPARSQSIDVRSSGTTNDTSFDITARSDLPERGPSTNRPYAAIVADAVAPLRDAIVGCMDRMPTSARPRYFALVVEIDGSLHARSPQPAPLPPRVAQCAEGVIASVTVQPSPPRPFAHDLSLVETSPAPERSR